MNQQQFNSGGPQDSGQGGFRGGRGGRGRGGGRGGFRGGRGGRGRGMRNVDGGMQGIVLHI